MIVYPSDWQKNYDDLSSEGDYILLSMLFHLKEVLNEIKVPHLAYSGGIDSTVMLAAMTQVYGKVNTYTISSREDHPDICFARLGSTKFQTNHHEFIVEPNDDIEDRFPGDNAVRQLFDCIKVFTDKVICCDGIDEFMCGYYDHQSMSEDKYKYYLTRLNPDHLMPLNKLSKEVRVYLPYLDSSLVEFYRSIPMLMKVDSFERKKIMIRMAQFLGVPKEIITRNKYGFCDAFIERNK